MPSHYIKYMFIYIYIYIYCLPKTTSFLDTRINMEGKKRLKTVETKFRADLSDKELRTWGVDKKVRTLFLVALLMCVLVED